MVIDNIGGDDFSSKYNEYLLRLTKEGLSRLGYTFNSEKSLKVFLSTRTKISYRLEGRQIISLDGNPFLFIKTEIISKSDRDTVTVSMKFNHEFIDENHDTD